MIQNNLDSRLLDESALRLLLEKLTHKHRGTHRWWSSPVVKNTELAKIMIHDIQFMNFILKTMKSDNTHFHPFKKIIIQQESKAREIYIQNWVDKIIQIRIQEIISEILDPVISKNVYSFKIGSGPVHAVEAFLKFAKSYKKDIFVLQLDISKYGDNIDQAILLSMLKTKLDLQNNPLLSSHITKLLNFNVLEDQALKKGQGIATGSPLVPLFENFYLLPVDQMIESSKPLFYCRYGDDMVLAYESRETLEENLQVVTKSIQEIKLSIHPEKIKITHLTEGSHFEWLGYKLTGKKQTEPKDTHEERIKKELRNEIHKHFFFLKQINQKCPSAEELSKSLENLEKKIYLKYANRFIYFYTSDSKAKSLDIFRIEETHKAICKNFRFGKKEAWKLLRKLKRKSANQTRMHFLRKKQWPKVPLSS